MVRPVEDHGRIHFFAVGPDLDDVEALVAQMICGTLSQPPGRGRVEDLHANAHTRWSTIGRAESEYRAGDFSRDQGCGDQGNNHEQRAGGRNATLHCPSDASSSTLSG